ncbi:hypothetical protein SAMN05421846_110128 [Chryseobacterium taeanense]|uniref:Uncharacterized protein n=2 Tax=Chryseobacterium taeanense TaxID=311334 RepID=A0A1G8M1Q3_9FLAO|nr:hypothetical protein SAMN05421846_110128 [Chryseobacterium taeanense]
MITTKQYIQERKNKSVKFMRKILLIILIFFFTFNKSAIKKQDLHNIIKGYIEYISKKRKVDKKNEILAVTFHDQTKEKSEYSIDVAFFKPEFMEGIQYNNVYIFEGYKLILPNNECKSIEKMFKKVAYENFNQKKTIVNYDFENWHIVLDKKDEVTFLSPIPISGCMKSILMSKKLKFSDSYEDITFSNPSPDCSKFIH